MIHVVMFTYTLVLYWIADRVYNFSKGVNGAFTLAATLNLLLMFPAMAYDLSGISVERYAAWWMTILLGGVVFATFLLLRDESKGKPTDEAVPD
jgi:uncharacterized membrane protein HdeD (DUF308 family)